MATLDGAATLEELAALVRSHLDVACTLVTRVTADRQYILAHAGLKIPDWLMRSTTLDYSICQHSAGMNFPLVIDDTFSHPLMRGNLAVEELGVAAYLGAPVHSRDDDATGAVCALEFHRRQWMEDDVTFIIAAAQRADRIISARH
jgi:GAF domain-containing protein